MTRLLNNQSCLCCGIEKADGFHTIGFCVGQFSFPLPLAGEFVYDASSLCGGVILTDDFPSLVIQPVQETVVVFEMPKELAV